MVEDPMGDMFSSFVREAFRLGWHLKEAKCGRGGSQSLLAHSLNSMSVCLRIGKILGWPEDRLRVVVASRAVHDIAKSRWECGSGPPPKAMTPDEEAEARAILRAMGLSEDEVEKAISLAQLDENPHDASEFLSQGAGPVDLDEMDLARVADGLASLKDPADPIYQDTESRLRRLGLSVTRHRVSTVRGISTQLLHAAVQDVYRKKGFYPVLYFASGTVYVGRGRPPEPSRDEIAESLEDKISRFLKGNPKRLAAAAMGRPNQTPIKAPEFVFSSPDAAEAFIRGVMSADVVSKPRVTEVDYSRWSVPEESEEGVPLDEGEREEIAKFYKGLKNFFTFFNDMIAEAERFGVEEAKSIATGVFRDAYGGDPPEGMFGLRFQTPNDKAREILEGVMRAVGLNFRILRDALNRLEDFAVEVARELASRAKGRGLSAEVLLDDLVEPPAADLRQVSDSAFESYCRGKERPHTPVCPICGRPAKVRGIASLHGGGVQAFNNLLRGGSTLSTGNKVALCEACDLEARLRSLLIDRWFDGEVMFAVPMVNASPETISSLWEGAAEFATKMEGTAGLLNDYLWSRLVSEDAYLRPPDEMWETLVHEAKSAGRGGIWKNMVKGVVNCLKSHYDDPEEAAEYLGVPGRSFRELAEALVDEGRVPDRCLEDVPLRVTLAPGNYVVMMIGRSVGGRKESEIGREIRRLFLATLLGVILQAAVVYPRVPLSVLPVDLTPRGYAEVPGHLGLREVVGRMGVSGGWVTIPSARRVLKRLASLIEASYGVGDLYGKDTLLALAKTHPGRVLARLSSDGKIPTSGLVVRLGTYWWGEGRWDT